ncbi:MAG: PAS domain S-box-containing protein [Planctomycetota bacterium]|jgi:PAS domain S-box-containing protein
MTATSSKPTGREVFFERDEIIVSKTDAKGIITYANDVFLAIAGYTEEETLGKPHNFIRHPDMPRSIFRLLWDTMSAGDEIFAYVMNLTKNGDHYWVLAHVTPTFGPSGEITGYHSNRRVPDRTAIDTILPIYKQLTDVEAGFSDRDKGIRVASAGLMEKLEALGLSYPEFVFSMQS